MALVSVRRLPEESASETTTESAEARTYLVEYTKTTPFANSCIEALTADDGTTAVPLMGAYSSGSSGPRVTSKDAVRDPENPFLIRVAVEYSDAKQDAEDPQQDGKWNIDVRIDAQKYTEGVNQDNEDHAIRNSAGELFPNTIERTRSDEEITITFRTRDVDQTNIDDCREKVNSDTVTMSIKGYVRSFGPRTLKLDKVTQSTVVEDGNDYWDMSYVLLCRRDGWTRGFVDMGLHTSDDDGVTLTPILDATGVPITEPTYLDGAGGQLAEGDPAVLLYFEIEEEEAFAGLFVGL